MVFYLSIWRNSFYLVKCGGVNPLQTLGVLPSLLIPFLLHSLALPPLQSSYIWGLADRTSSVFTMGLNSVFGVHIVIMPLCFWTAPPTHSVLYKGQNPLHQFPRRKSVTSWREKKIRRVCCRLRRVVTQISLQRVTTCCQLVGRVANKSATSRQLPCLRGSYGETCVMDCGHYSTTHHWMTVSDRPASGSTRCWTKVVVRGQLRLISVDIAWLYSQS